MNGARGTIGIAPPGALGVSFYYHLTGGMTALDGAVYFMGLDGSRSARALRQGLLHIRKDGKTWSLEGERIIVESLDAAFEAGKIPEVLLVCPNPDQLLGVITSLVTLLEKMAARGDLHGSDLYFPTVVLSSNGIYFQRVRQIFVEKLEEATLFGRLPDLWPDLMPRIVGKLLRGVTIQTGLRDGSGAEAVYIPGDRGLSRLAGGDPKVRERCCELFSERGAWFELAKNSAPTRLEFDKGIINLIANFFGLIHAFGDDGSFRPLRVEEILVPENTAEVQELIRHVFDVGVAVKAYGPGDSYEQVVGEMLHLSLVNAKHVPSSLQWVDLRIRQGLLTAEFTPTEEWLITPLIKYARSAGLAEAERYFESLRARLLTKLRRAVARAR
ncbi:MAG TPA: hypothetical protein VIT21_02080 [Chthoniobacterales bacterium]